MPKYYAGIGSRSTPADVLELMTRLAYALDADGWTLRSGHAPGADQAFELGAIDAHIYLPWPSFEQAVVKRDSAHFIPSPAAWTFPIAKRLHPAWDRLAQGGRKLMARNVHQVRGHEPDSKLSSFVVCWTKDARGGGGTGQALRLAHEHGVPVFDLANAEVRARLTKYVEAYERHLDEQQADEMRAELANERYFEEVGSTAEHLEDLRRHEEFMARVEEPEFA